MFFLCKLIFLHCFAVNELNYWTLLHTNLLLRPFFDAYSYVIPSSQVCAGVSEWMNHPKMERTVVLLETYFKQITLYGSTYLCHKACVHCILESNILARACVAAPFLLQHWQAVPCRGRPSEEMASCPAWRDVNSNDHIEYEELFLGICFILLRRFQLWQRLRPKETYFHSASRLRTLRMNCYWCSK